MGLAFKLLANLRLGMGLPPLTSLGEAMKTEEAS
jgi:hypothetical protein